MDVAQTIGTIAGVLTTASFVPQVIQTWKTKSTRDISLAWSFTLTVGIGLWFTYGLMIGELPVIVANGLSLVLSCAVLAMKLLFKGEKPVVLD